MHTKCKTYQVNQIISYGRKHYQFLSTLYLGVTFSYYLSFTVPVSAVSLSGFMPLNVVTKSKLVEPQVLGKLLSTLQNWNRSSVPRQAIWQCGVRV